MRVWEVIMRTLHRHQVERRDAEAGLKESRQAAQESQEALKRVNGTRAASKRAEERLDNHARDNHFIEIISKIVRGAL